MTGAPATAVAASLAAALAVFPPPAAAQSSLGLRGYGSFGVTMLAASQTFKAVADTSSAPTFGGGAQVTGIWRGLFADLAIAQQRLDGERVFVLDGTVLDLGIPLEVTVRPVDVAAGWRFGTGRVSAYAGAGLTYLTYEERSDFAAGGEDVSESRTGPLVLAGFDVPIWRWLHAGAELRYRRVAGILGAAGASAEFGEDDAGGFSGGVRISIGR